MEEEKEFVLAYLDDVDGLGDHDNLILFIDMLWECYEAVTRAILNQNRKKLSSLAWAHRQEWPLPWIASPPHLNIYKVAFAMSSEVTVSVSWAPPLPDFFGPALQMPAGIAQCITTMAGAFLLRDHLERLAWQELHGTLEETGLTITDVLIRAQTMWVKEAS